MKSEQCWETTAVLSLAGLRGSSGGPSGEGGLGGSEKRVPWLLLQEQPEGGEGHEVSSHTSEENRLLVCGVGTTVHVF